MTSLRGLGVLCGEIFLRGGYAAFGFWLVIDPGSVRAETFNYGTPPIGGRAAAVGGAGTGGTNDASTIHFNPAGLAFLAGEQWHGLASGYIEVGSATQEAAFLGEDIRTFTLDGMMSFAGVGRAFPWGGFGFAFVTPERRTEEALKRFASVEFQDGLSSEPTVFSQGRYFMDSRVTVMQMGPAVSIRPWSGTWAIGFGAYYSARRAQVARAYSLWTEEREFIALETAYEQLSQSILLRYGVSVEPTERIGLGITFEHHLPVRDAFSVSRLTADVKPASLLELLEDVSQGGSLELALEQLLRDRFSESDDSFQEPLALRAGLRWGLTARTQAWLDGVLYWDVRQTFPDLPPPYERDKREKVFNLHTGVETTVSERLTLRGGFYTDFSHHRAIDRIPAAEVDTLGIDRRTPRDADEYHGTLGIGYAKGPVGISVTSDVGFGRGRLVDVLGKTQDEDRQRLILSLASDFRF